MSGSRLSTVLDDGLIPPPVGPVWVLRPGIGYDLSALPGACVVETHYPDHAWWLAMGRTVSRQMPSAEMAVEMAVVVVPRAKALARAMVAEAVMKAGRVLVDGQKTQGVDSLWRDLRKRLDRDLPNLTKAHGRLFWFDSLGVELADWAMAPPARGPEGHFTQPGVFSDGAVDRGSALLAAALPAAMPRRVADLGAGWGYLSAAVLARDGVAHLDLIEAEALALDCARLNIADPRAAFHWADATTFRPEAKYGAVVSNPPFHAGRAADPGLGKAFIAAAARILEPWGTLWLVANRHLPYEQALREAFVTVDEVGGDGAFKVFSATRPKA